MTQKILKMARNLSIKNLFDKKFSVFAFTGHWLKAFGTPEKNGIWIVWGVEKNGKTWFALLLSDYLSKFKKVLYISAEEGTNKDFVDAIKRAKISDKNKNLKFSDYISIDDLREKMKSRKSPDVIVLDNCTVYATEMKAKDFQALRRDFPNKLFIFLAHEEKKAPYTALAGLCKKYANVIVHVVGLAAHISGRVPGGVISIDENKAALYWGAKTEEIEN